MACAACEEPTSAPTPHYRGGGNHPLCAACADPETWVACAACGEPSHPLLLLLGVCPCVPVAELFTRGSWAERLAPLGGTTNAVYQPLRGRKAA
jgi:hypothetical protein